ncbi:MAG: VTT domain-containing protein [Chloroflexota bacterium]
MKPGEGRGAESETTSLKRKTLTAILRVLAVLVVVAISAYVFSIRERVDQYAALGYPGIFLVALLANATVFLPAPGIAVVFAMGSVFNPFGVALAAGTGGALGELSGYLAGFGGQGMVENTAAYRRVQPWVQKWGVWGLLVLAAIPNPFFDLAGVAAGTLKIRVWKFLLFVWIGQLIKMSFFAFAGNTSLNLFFK